MSKVVVFVSKDKYLWGWVSKDSGISNISCITKSLCMISNHMDDKDRP